MINDIKEDCPLNSTIILEFEEKKIKGELVFIDDRKLKIKTETGISTFVSKKINNVLSYEIINNKIPNNIEVKKPPVTDKNPIEVQKPIENKKEVKKTEEDTNKKITQPFEYNNFKENIKNTDLKFPYQNFYFKIKKVKKYDVDNDTYELSQKLFSIEEKYKYAEKQNDKIRRYNEILSTLKILQSNNYFNDDLRYNIAFITYKLEKYEDAIITLKQVQEISEKKDFCLFLSFLYFSIEEYKKSCHYFSLYIQNENIDTKTYLFFLKLVLKTKYFNSVIKYLRSSKIQQTKQDIYFSTLFFLEIIQANEQLTKQFSTYSEKSDIDTLIDNNLELLTQENKETISIIKSEHKKLSSNSEIIQYWPNSDSGQLRFYKSNGNVFLANFKVSDIIEESVKTELNSVSYKAPIPVFCYITDDSNFKRSRLKRAYAIQYPKNLELEIDLVKNLINKEEYEDAEGLVKQVLIQYPNEIVLKDLLDEIPEEEPEIIDYKSPYTRPSRGNIYKSATRARQRKQLDKAKELFEKAIKSNDNKESAIKDLASIYAQENNNKEAIKLVENNLNSMKNKESAFNFLSHLYFKNEQYSDAVELLKKVLALNPTKRVDLRKRSIEIKKRISQCYYRDGDYRNAKKYLQEIIKKEPKDYYVKISLANCFYNEKDYKTTKKLLNEILKSEPDFKKAKELLDALIEAEQTGSYVEMDSLFRDTDFNILTSGLSSLLKKVLEKKELYGVPATVKANEEFSKGTLSSIRNLVEKAGRARPKERADYLLTEANLIQIIEPDNEIMFKSVLAKYCNAMALSCASLNYPSEIIRNYYIEAFSLEKDYKAIANQVAIFLSSFYLQGEKIIIEHRVSLSIDNVIDKIFTLKELPTFFWDGILEMSIISPVITAQLLSKIFQNNKAKTSVFEFLNNISVGINTNDSETVFKTKWNEARTLRQSEYNSWFDTINSLNNTTDFNSLIALIETSFQQLKSKWLQETDTARLESIIKDIAYIGTDYLKQTTFDEKERLSGIIKTSIERLSDEIEKQPTRFSYEGFLPILSHIDNLIQEHFNNVLKSSTPIVNLQILGEFVVKKNNQLEIEIAIKNEDRQKAPIYDINISVQNTNECKLVGSEITISETIRGGDTEIEKILIEVSNQVVSQKAGDIELLCKYKTRNLEDEQEIISGHTINLYNESEFEPIDNIFARYANSNAVTEKSMFYGRDKFINEIVETFSKSSSKSVVIYGQKRSGKSSVLFHLKKSLNDTKKAFCIDFSLGALVTEWSITSFYYKILSEIHKELRKIKSNGENIPKFERPSIEQLEKHPTIIFQERMEVFLDNCKKTDGWKNKKLTILIDEFTYLYSSIQRNLISGDFMKNWKDIIDQSYFNSVLIGQDVMPDFKAKFPNQFGITEDKRLNYLSKEDARALIEKPIWYHKKNESRFIGNAVDKIIDYTAGNPYYIQIFCDKLVSFMNNEKRKLIRVTEVTVREVAELLIKGKEALTEDKFDNLLTAGDADLEANKVEYTFEVLKQIAGASKYNGSCSKQAIIDRIESEEILKNFDNILKDLLRRQVISLLNGLYKIQVQLFQDWLLNKQI